MSAHKGFALPLIIIAILIPVIILAAWAPWVTKDFAKKKVLLTIKQPCAEFKTPEVVYDFKTTFPADLYRFNLKELFDFGRQTTIVVNCSSQTQTLASDTYFVSFIGTVHKLSSHEYKLSQETKNPDETVYTDEGSANWKTYTNTKNRYSIQYPSNLQLIVDNNRPSITNNNNGTEHYFNISIDVSDNLKNQTTQDFVNMSKILTASGEYKNPFVSPKLYTNGVIKGMISDVTNGDDYYAEEIQVNNGQIYEFKLLSGPDTGTKPTDEDKTTFNKILSTFQFLN